MSAIGKFSFLIAFADQLEKAITEDHGIDRVADAVESLASSLAVLLSDSSESAGGDDDGDAESIDDIDSPGPDTPLGAALARIAELERATADVVRTRKLRAPQSADAGAGMDVGRQRRDTAVLKGGRRGKKSKK